MGFARFYLSALASRALSTCVTFVLVSVMAALAGADVFMTVLAWFLTSALLIGTWSRFESILLRLGWWECRPLDALERESLEPVLDGLGDELLVIDRAGAWLVRGLHTLVMGSGMLDLLEDRELRGVIMQATLVNRASVAGSLVVWIGNLPLLAAWYVGRWFELLGQALALLVGRSLLLPMLIWRDGFVKWGGRVFGAVLAGMFASLLLTSGMALAGAALMTAWVLVPALRALVAWESRQAERAADEAVIQAGLGWDLLAALEQLRWLDPEPQPPGLLGLLARPVAPVRMRLDRVWRALAQPRDA